MNKKLNEKLKKKKKGFTLVELIIVIAIIAILAAMAIPRFGAMRLDARISNDISVAKNIQTAAAVLVANGTLSDNESAFAADAEAGITARVSGDLHPTAGVNDGTPTYQVTIVDGDVTVESSEAPGTPLAPADDQTTAAYRQALNK